jgi:hypothetical protein
MLRWFIVFLLAMVVFQGATAWLRRIGLGRLPGDFTVRVRGKDLHVPLASCLLLSGAAMLIGLLF